LNTTFLNRVEAGLTGSYQIQDTASSVETLIGRFTLDYPIQDWIKAGAHYQYATRTADDAGEEYDDNRIGLFVTLSL
jgi:long-subunit fatty acid transport protein